PDLDFGDVFFAFRRKLPILERVDHRPVENARRVGRHDGHFGHVALFVDLQARNDAALFDLRFDCGLREFRILAAEALDPAPDRRLRRRRWCNDHGHRRRRCDRRRLRNLRDGGFRRDRGRWNVRRRHERRRRRRRLRRLDLLRRWRRRWKFHFLDDRHVERLLDEMQGLAGEAGHQGVDDEGVHRDDEHDADGVPRGISLLPCVIHGGFDSSLRASCRLRGGGGWRTGMLWLTEWSWIGIVMISITSCTSITSISGVVLMSIITSGSLPGLPMLIAIASFLPLYRASVSCRAAAAR